MTGDEFFCRLVCPAFNEARKKCMKCHYWENPPVNKMNELLNVDKVGQFVDIVAVLEIRITS